MRLCDFVIVRLCDCVCVFTFKMDPLANHCLCVCQFCISVRLPVLHLAVPPRLRLVCDPVAPPVCRAGPLNEDGWRLWSNSADLDSDLDPDLAPDGDLDSDIDPDPDLESDLDIEQDPGQTPTWTQTYT